MSTESLSHPLGIRIDARMLGRSGIGIVIDALASRWITKHPDVNFQVLLDPNNHCLPPWLYNKNVLPATWNVPIYSVQEQWTRIPAASFRIHVSWCPHYNLSVQLGRNVVTTIHDVLHLDRSVQRRSLSQSMYANAMFRWVKFRSKGVHFVSEFTRNQFGRFVGAPSGEDCVAYNAASDEWQSQNLEFDSDSRLPFNYVIFVGNAFRHKNLVRLIRAISLVRQGTDLHLVQVGKIEGLKNLDHEALSVANLSKEFVHLKGCLSFCELKSLVRHSKAVVLPSVYEGFGLPPLEASCVGVSSVISDIPVHRELYNGYAIFVDPFSIEDIARGLRDVVRTPIPPGELVSFSHRFGWDRTAAMVFSLLKRCAKPHG